MLALVPVRRGERCRSLVLSTLGLSRPVPLEPTLNAYNFAFYCNRFQSM